MCVLFCPSKKEMHKYVNQNLHYSCQIEPLCSQMQDFNFNIAKSNRNYIIQETTNFSLHYWCIKIIISYIDNTLQYFKTSNSCIEQKSVLMSSQSAANQSSGSQMPIHRQFDSMPKCC